MGRAQSLLSLHRDLPAVAKHDQDTDPTTDPPPTLPIALSNSSTVHTHFACPMKLINCCASQPWKSVRHVSSLQRTFARLSGLRSEVLEMTFMDHCETSTPSGQRIIILTIVDGGS